VTAVSPVRLLPAALLVAALLLVGCGGGDDSSPAPSGVDTTTTPAETATATAPVEPPRTITETLPAPAVSPFPAVFQDVALIVGDDVAAQSVVEAVRDGAGELLEDVRLFDVYTGPQIGEGRKSLALALRFRATDRTLTEDEASAARDAAVTAAGNRVGAEQRR
jgi:phenylalanyl-tRNA synthetase beta chain